MEKFKRDDIIQSVAHPVSSDRLLIVQNVNPDGSLYCMDMPKSWFGRRSVNNRYTAEFPSYTIEPATAIKIGYLEPRNGYMEPILL